MHLYNKTEQSFYLIIQCLLLTRGDDSDVNTFSPKFTVELHSTIIKQHLSTQIHSNISAHCFIHLQTNALQPFSVNYFLRPSIRLLLHSQWSAFTQYQSPNSQPHRYLIGFYNLVTWFKSSTWWHLTLANWWPIFGNTDIKQIPDNCFPVKFR